MDLIIWRHAEAQDNADPALDFERPLTPRGFKQATRMAGWLDRQLPDSAKIFSSPARRCTDTADRLDRKYKTIDGLLMNANVDQLLESLDWPEAKATVVLIGHQPMLGQLIAKLLGFKEDECAIRKSTVWWLRSRERNEKWETVLVTVQSADML